MLFVEFEEKFVEYFDDEKSFPWSPASIGFYKMVLNKLGFEMSLDAYERCKEKFPNEINMFDIGALNLKKVILDLLQIIGIISWELSLENNSNP